MWQTQLVATKKIVPMLSCYHTALTGVVQIPPNVAGCCCHIKKCNRGLLQHHKQRLLVSAGHIITIMITIIVIIDRKSINQAEKPPPSPPHAHTYTHVFIYLQQPQQYKTKQQKIKLVIIVDYSYKPTTRASSKCLTTNRGRRRLITLHATMQRQSEPHAI